MKRQGASWQVGHGIEIRFILTTSLGGSAIAAAASLVGFGSLDAAGEVLQER